MIFLQTLNHQFDKKKCSFGFSNRAAFAMSYKETLFFIGKCLVINHDVASKVFVEKKLLSNAVDWDKIVKLSTDQLVFPAVYLSLKRANFLHYLPKELLNFMVDITDVNRIRNQKIIAQALELNELLLSNHITPIFLKGVGGLLEGLFEDIAERMVGDIDFILSKDDYPKAISILKTNGYELVEQFDYHFPSYNHYPRVQKNGAIAAVEIHFEMTTEKFATEFHFDLIRKNSQIINNVNVMSFAHQISLIIISSQINDHWHYYKTIPLKNAYDVLLLSRKTTVINAFDDLPRLHYFLNCFMAICKEIFNNADSLTYRKSKAVEIYLESFHRLMKNDKNRNLFLKGMKWYLYIKIRLKLIFNALLNKKFRLWLIKRITDKNWFYLKRAQIYKSLGKKTEI